MRQFVVGLLVVVVLWWWSSSGEKPADSQVVAPTSGAPPAAAPGAKSPDLQNLLVGSEQKKAPAGPPAATPAVAPSNGALDAKAAEVRDASAAKIDVDGLLVRVGQRDAASVSEAWHALASGAAASQRQRVAEALKPASDEFSAMLAGLGADNAFLHSGEGRAAGAKVLAVALRMPDGDAVSAISQLLSLSLRGRVQKGDAEVRAFIDDAYRQHLLRVDRWICDPANVARARSYTVKKGDSLAGIAKAFRREGIMVEEGTLAVLNRIHNMNSLQVDQRLKVPIDPVLAVVEKRSYSMAVYVGDDLLRMYWVGHGENDKTPVTEFIVGEKQPRPEWTAPDGERYPYGHPKNILGEYFIKFRHDRYTGFGAHGTPMPETIGTMSSMGCVRMLAPDIAEVFRLLPRGAKVQVRASESIS